MDCSLPGFSVHGVLQTRMLQWVAISFSRGSSPPRDRTRVSCIASGFFITKPSGKSIYQPLKFFLKKILLTMRKVSNGHTSPSFLCSLFNCLPNLKLLKQKSIRNSSEYKMRDDVQCPSIQWTFLIKTNGTRSCNYENAVVESFFYFSN